MSDTLVPRHNDVTSDPPVHAETPCSCASSATNVKKTIPPITEALCRPFSPCGRITLSKSFSDSIAANPPSGQPIAGAAYNSPNGEDYIVMVHFIPVTKKSREEFEFLKVGSDAAIKKRAAKVAGLNEEERILVHVAKVVVSAMVLWGLFWGGIVLLKKGAMD